MEKMSDIDILKAKNVSERDIEMFRLHMQGVDEGGERWTYKRIAEKFGLKNAVSVSRRIRKIQGILQSIDRGVKSGDIVLKSSGGKVAVSGSKGQGAMSLALPENNPFPGLNTFQELGSIASAGGSVIGMGAATLAQGFTREDLPYEERQMMVMKGGSVIVSSLLALYLTFNKFSQVPNKEMKTIDEKGDEVGRS